MMMTSYEPGTRYGRRGRAAAPPPPPGRPSPPSPPRPPGWGGPPPRPRRAPAAVLPRRAGAAAPAAGLDPEPIRGGDGIAVGEHEVGPGVADLHGCDDQLV